jgi:hypothetical protein
MSENTNKKKPVIFDGRAVLQLLLSDMCCENICFKLTAPATT